MNTINDMDAAKAVVAATLGGEDGADTLDVAPAPLGPPPELNSMAALALMLELEQRLRIASLRIAIEGEDVTAGIVEALAKLAAFVDDKLH